MNNSSEKSNCQTCGAQCENDGRIIECRFCGFKKNIANLEGADDSNLLFAKDINQFFKDKHAALKNGETFNLTLPVTRFYKQPKPLPGQINFFKSKNIMFLLEQHGFQMVTRKSRFSCELDLIVRKV